MYHTWSHAPCTDLSQEIARLEQDVKHCVNETTLGPYSFRIFVDAAWTQEHMVKAGKVGPGRRKRISAGPANLKRPRIADIQSSQSSKSQVLLFVGHWNEEGEGVAAQDSVAAVSESHEGGRVTRSRNKGKENHSPY